MVSSLDVKDDEPALDAAEADEIDPWSLSSTTTSLGSYCRRWAIIELGVRISGS